MKVMNERAAAYVNTNSPGGLGASRAMEPPLRREFVANWIREKGSQVWRLTCRMLPEVQQTRICGLLLGLLTLLSAHNVARSQVGPAEITNPQLKSLETAYLSQLMSMREAITRHQFPFSFFLNRYVGLDPKVQTGVDPRGLEFVLFQGRPILKISGNYNAAFNSARLTQNQRAGRIFTEAIVPILQIIPEYFNVDAGFSQFGFEISYHVRTRAGGYDYEGKEILVVVLNKKDALDLAHTQTDAARQDVLNASKIYVNGKEFGLALDSVHMLDADTLAEIRQTRAVDGKNQVPAAYRSAVKIGLDSPSVLLKPAVKPEEGLMRVADKSGATLAESMNAQAEALQNRLQPQLDTLGKEGLSRYHFVDYAPPSLVSFRNRIHLQMTLRNPNPFDKHTTSIYRRAEQSFDLFLAPLIKSLLNRAPADGDIVGFDITVLNQFGADTKGSPEALEFVLPLEPLRQFADAMITNQDLINQSIVMVNGVRIALDLQRVGE